MEVVFFNLCSCLLSLDAFDRGCLSASVRLDGVMEHKFGHLFEFFHGGKSRSAHCQPIVWELFRIFLFLS